MTGVFADLPGQDAVVAQLRRAAAGAATVLAGGRAGGLGGDIPPEQVSRAR